MKALYLALNSYRRPALSSSFVIFALLSFSSTVFAKGSPDIDAVRCADGKVYSWDYIRAQSQTNLVRAEYLTAKSAKEIPEGIAKQLAPLHPELSVKLRDFRNGRKWTASSSKPLSLSVEIPAECKVGSEAIELYQAVIREKNKQVSYAYDQNILKALEENHPLQLSFLYVHEFLRDFTDDPDVLRQVNQFLHQDLSQTNFYYFERKIKQLGLKKLPRLPHIGYLHPVFTPKGEVKMGKTGLAAELDILWKHVTWTPAKMDASGSSFNASVDFLVIAPVKIPLRYDLKRRTYIGEAETTVTIWTATMPESKWRKINDQCVSDKGCKTWLEKQKLVAKFPKARVRLHWTRNKERNNEFNWFFRLTDAEGQVLNEGWAQ